MVRETRHLWVGNLPENIREDRIKEYFKRYTILMLALFFTAELHDTLVVVEKMLFKLFS